MIIFNVGYYVVFTYLPTYFIKTLHFSKTSAFVSITVACVVAIVLILPLAALSDRIGRRPLLIAGTLAFAVLAYPLFLLLNSGSVGAAIAAHALLAAIESIYISVAVATGVELFATRVRYSGFSIGYNVCVAAFGGTTPYMVAWLTGSTGNNLAPAFYVIVAAVVSLVTVLTLRESRWASAARGPRRRRGRGPLTHREFTAYGPSHWAVLAVFAIGAVLLVWVGRRQTEAQARTLGRILGALTALIYAAVLIYSFIPPSIKWSVPLQLTDLATTAGAYALWSQRHWAVALTYYWGLVLSVQALISPVLRGPDFPELPVPGLLGDPPARRLGRDLPDLGPRLSADVARLPVRRRRHAGVGGDHVDVQQHCRDQLRIPQQEAGTPRRCSTCSARGRSTY